MSDPFAGREHDDLVEPLFGGLRGDSRGSVLVYHRRHARLVAILTERNQLLPGASLILDQAEDLPGLPSDPSDGLAHWCARQREWVEGWRALARALQPNELPAGVRFAGWPVIGAFVRARIGR